MIPIMPFIAPHSRKISLLLLAAASNLSFAYPLPYHITKAYDCTDCNQLSQAYLNNDWPMKNQTLSHALSQPRHNFSYRMTVSGKQLQQGLDLNSLHPGALVEVQSPQNPIPEITLLAKHACDLLPPKARPPYCKTYALNSVHNSLTAQDPHHASLLLPKQFIQGANRLKAEEADPEATYTVQVTDNLANAYLSVETDKLEYSYGDFMTVTIKYNDMNGDFPTNQLYAKIISPDEKATYLALDKIRANVYQGRTQLLSEQVSRGRNWRVKVEAVSFTQDIGTTRNAHAAFSYALPSASLRSIEKINDSPLTFRVHMQVATASRYQLSAVLLDRVRHPFHYAQAAQWLPAGEQTLDISFPGAKASDWQNASISHIHLMDYGQLKHVYHYDRSIPIQNLG